MINNILSAFLFLCLVILVIIGKYTLDRCENKKITSFIALLGVIFLAVLGYLMKITANGADGAFTAVRVMILGLQLLFPVFFVFVANLIEIKINKIIVFMIFLIPIANVLLVWTTLTHGLIYIAVEFNSDIPIPSVITQRGPLFMTLHVYPMLGVLACLAMLIKKLFECEKHRRITVVFLIIASVVPVIANLFVLLGWNVLGINYTPISMAIVSVLLFINIIRHNLLDIVPIATEMALRTIKEAYILVDDDRNFVYANEAAMTLLPSIRGLTKEQSISLVETLPFKLPEENEEIVSPVQFSMPGNSYYTANISALSGENQGMTGFSILIQDITEFVQLSKKIEESVLEANARLMAMLDTSPLGVQIRRRNQEIIDCNEAGVKLYGFKDKQEYMDRFVESCSPEYQPDGQRSAEKAVALVNKAFEEGICVFDWVHKMPDEDTEIPTEITLIRSKYKDEEVIIGYTRDMREYYRLLDTINNLMLGMLNYEEGNFDEVIFKAMEKMGCTVNVDRVYIWKNQDIDGKLRCAQLYQWADDAEALYENAPTKFTPFPMDWYLELSANKCVNGVVWDFPARERDRLQAKGVVSIIVVPVFLNYDFWGFVSFEDCRNERTFSMFEEGVLRTVSFLFANGIMRNDTDSRLISATQGALAAARAKSTFLANMSHEIRTPMNAILGVTEIMMYSETLSKEVEDGLGKIHSSCDLLLGIINDILDFSKMESGKLDIMPAQYEVASLINDSVNLNMMQISSKNIEFDVQVDENVPALLFGDVLRIKQILNNLLSNAFKYTDSGKVTLSVSSVKGAEKGTIDLVVSVRDTGVGLSEEQLEKLFVEYTRFNQSSGKAILGTGLGLAITRGLINLMSGEIQVESKPGVGSRFLVKLPQGLVSDEILGESSAKNLGKVQEGFAERWRSNQISRKPMPNGSVLIVDDVKTNIYVAEGLLKLYKLKTESVLSGNEAIEKVKSGKVYDIIFMDHMMPEMDGIQATALLRELGYTHPIVALTANAVSGQAEYFLKSGFDDFISKPIDTRQLDLVLNRYVQDKQPEAIGEAGAEIESGDNEADSREGNLSSDLLFLQHIDGLDTQKGALTIGGTKEFYLEVLEAFCDDTLLRIENVRKSREDGDLRLYTTHTHALKSAAAYIGAEKMSERAYVLETAGDGADISFIEDNTESFLAELESLVTDIKQAFSLRNKDSAYASDFDPAVLKSELEKLRVALNDMDAGTINSTVDNLSAIKCPEEIKPIIGKISMAVLMFDFDEAEQLIESLL